MSIFNLAFEPPISQAIELVNISINSQLCYVSMGTTWKNTGFVGEPEVLLVINFSLQLTAVFCLCNQVTATESETHNKQFQQIT